MYSLIRPLLFQSDPERAHALVFRVLRMGLNSPLKSIIESVWGHLPDYPVTLAGLTFKHPVGLAAGFDKDGILYPHWGALGFAFAELGTVTPRPQEGNPKPRLFRLTTDKALINRMGFNNAGVEALAQKLASAPKDIIIGGNIGKNKDTPNASAASDYIQCVQTLSPYVDYFTLNISSPNTPGLRELQEKEPLAILLKSVIESAKAEENIRPVFVKIAPDMDTKALSELLEVLMDAGADGIVAGNTSLSREGLISPDKIKNETGGLSGKPLEKRSTEIIRFIKKETSGKLPVIGVGGIFSPEDAKAKLDAGADLIQLYTGYVYEGPSLPGKILRYLGKN